MVEENQEDEYEVVVKIFPPDGKIETRPAEDAPASGELTVVNIPALDDIKTEDSFVPEPDPEYA
jgi:hypothetical protein